MNTEQEKSKERKKTFIGLKVSKSFDDILNTQVKQLKDVHGFSDVTKSDLIRTLVEYRIDNAAAIWLELKTQMFHVEHSIPRNKYKRRRGRI